MSDDGTETSRGWKRRVWPLVKWSLLAIVLIYVGRRGWQLWLTDKDALQQTQWRPGWLIAAGMAYAAGWAPSVWFWRAMMHELGGHMSTLEAARAYYCGHLGKYVPGKATVLVIRSALVRNRGLSMAQAALTVTIETLVMMGAGLAVAVALAPQLMSPARISQLPQWLQAGLSTAIIPPLIVLGLTAALLPVFAQVFSWLATRMTPADIVADRGEVHVRPKLLAFGLAAFVGGWACHGLSLGLTIRAVGGDALDLTQWPLWMGSVSLATVVGFVAIFAPGGVGVREALLFETLQSQPGLTPQLAVAAALFLRVVWFLTEIAAAGLLYWMIRPPGDSAQADDSLTRESGG